MVGWRRSGQARRPEGPDCHDALEALRAPDSAWASSCETLVGSLQLLPLKQPPRILLVTSTQPQEGKTTLAVNLALYLALTGRSTLLADADLRRPGLHRMFGLDASPGFADLLVGEAEREEVVRRVRIRDADDLPLEVIPSGVDTGHAFGRMEPSRMETVFVALAARREFIVIDSPPVLAVSDALMLAPVVDGVVLVVRAGAVREDDARLAKQRVERAGGEVLGIVLNGLDERAHGPSYHSYGR